MSESRLVRAMTSPTHGSHAPSWGDDKDYDVVRCVDGLTFRASSGGMTYSYPRTMTCRKSNCGREPHRSVKGMKVCSYPGPFYELEIIFVGKSAGFVPTGWGQYAADSPGHFASVPVSAIIALVLQHGGEAEYED